MNTAMTTAREANTTEDPGALFVYGTLRPSATGRRIRALDRLRSVRTDARLPGWELYGSTYIFPYAMPGGSGCVYGDLLTFHEDDWPAALKLADQIEGYPRHYDRKLVTVDLWRGQTARAWVYTPAPDMAAQVREHQVLIASGDWNDRQRL